jgi:hypothetical protein
LREWTNADDHLQRKSQLRPHWMKEGLRDWTSAATVPISAFRFRRGKQIFLRLARRAESATSPPPKTIVENGPRRGRLLGAARHGDLTTSSARISSLPRAVLAGDADDRELNLPRQVIVHAF